MFRFISKKLRFFSLINKNSEQCGSSGNSISEPLSHDLQKNIEGIKNKLCNSSDIAVHEFNFGQTRKLSGALVFIESMVNTDEIHENILRPLMYDALLLKNTESINYSDMDMVRRNIISLTGSRKSEMLNDLTDSILTGAVVLLVDSSKEALAINCKKREMRNVEEPQTESVVRGPREGFNENAKISIALIRSKIKDTNLCVENFKIGERSKTEVYLAYLKNITNAKLIEEVKLRLKRIKVDAVLESGYIEQYIEDSPYSIFPTVSNSEKPDKVVAKILEGRVAIVVDGTPFVLAVPMIFLSSFQSAEDYYSRPFLSGILRIIRFLSYMISILAPATYVALTVFHQELIPTQLLISIASGREKVPYPAILEAFLMLLTFDILREAGVRLPRPVGQTVSIVGALVLGQAAVEAGLISPLMVIVVAITAISSFVVPPQIDSGTVLRYIYLILAGFLGGFGIIMGLLVTLVHLASLRSFGTPYLWPIAPLDLSGFKDVFIRMPLWTMIKRPKAVVWDNDSQRQKDGLKPKSDTDDNLGGQK